MRPRTILTLFASISIAVTAQMPTRALADGHGDFVAGVALGVLGSAIAHHHHKHGAPYQNHPGVSPEENAIGLCMHRTKTAMSNQGYYAVDFEQTLSYETNADGIDQIDLEVARSSDRTDARSYIKAHCAIQNDSVVNFRYSAY